MSKVYGEPVDVWVSGGRPARFGWRGRLYLVLGILDHWVASREWWQQRGLIAGEPAELQFWQLEASPGGGSPAGTYELRRDAATGDWLLTRVWD